MDPIMAIAQKYGLKVIEDTAQCIGGVYKGRKVGTVGDAGAFSFCQSKHFTTGGEGGMVVTNNEEAGWNCRAIRDHGYDVRKKFDLMSLCEEESYVHNTVGYNFRMTEVQLIIGLNELERFDSWNMENRYKYARMYDDAFTGLKGIQSLPLNTEDRKNSYWMYPIILDLDMLDTDAFSIVMELKNLGIPVSNIQWPEAYKEKAYLEHNGFGKAKFPFESKEYTRESAVDYKNTFCPVANSLIEKTLSLYLHPTWRSSDIEICMEYFKKVLEEHLI